MFEMILLVSLGAFNTPNAISVQPPIAPVQTAQFKPCVWPNRCASVQETPVVAQFKPCVWPNRCASVQETPIVAQFKPCVWPNRCGAAEETVID